MVHARMGADGFAFGVLRQALSRYWEEGGALGGCGRGQREAGSRRGERAGNSPNIGGTNRAGRCWVQGRPILEKIVRAAMKGTI